MRRLVYLFLLLIIPLHAFALQGGWLPQGKPVDLMHEIDHQQSNSHHHDQDGSIHYDDSPESATHLADSDCCQQTGSMPPPVLCLPSFSSPSDNPADPGMALPQRFPECPQRPPSAQS